MDEKIITEVKKSLNKNYKDIYAIDVLNDCIYEMHIENDNLSIKNKLSFDEFMNKMNKKVHPEDIKRYFDMFSLNKLEQLSQSGITESKFKYRMISETGDYHTFINIVNFFEIDGTKLISMISEDINDRLIEEEKETQLLQSKINDYQKRIEDETESISEAILKINNVLDTNEFQSSNMLSTKDYINSVFSRVSADHPELNKAIMAKITNESNYRKQAILIVDDSSIIRNSLKRIFADEFNILFAKDGEEAIKIIDENIVKNTHNTIKENIVGVLLDLLMPNVDGFGVLDYMKKNNLMSRIPVAIISGDETKETRKRVYEYDIVDMLEKPFNTENIRKRISKIINLYISGNNLQSIVDIQNVELESKKKENINTLKEIIRAVVSNIKNKNDNKKIRNLVRIFASNVINDSKQVERIVDMSPLYNIGAIAISDNVLITKESINEEINYGLSIADAIDIDEDARIVLYEIIKNSCELYDGSGYPNNLSKDSIPLSASITNIVVRLVQYTKIYNFDKAYNIITEKEKEKYNPILIDVLIKCKSEIKDLFD